MVKENTMKQTEIGMLPDNWEVVSVEKLVTNKILQKPLDGNHGNIHPKSSDFVDEGIPFIMASDVYNNKVNFSTCYHITKLQADRLQKGFSNSGDVLLTHKGTVGNTAIVPEISFPYIMLTPQVTFYRVLDWSKLNNVFLKNVLDSKNLQDQIESISGSGATRAYIGITQQRTLQIPLPPLPEQEAIAEALSDADAWIESLEQLIAKKRLIKQGAMQELLTPKEDWEVKKLGEVFKLKQGVQCGVEKQFKNHSKGLVRFIRIVDVTQKNTEVRFISDPGIDHHINCNDLFMVRYGAPGVTGFNYEGVIANNLFRLIPKIEIVNPYFKHFFDFIKSTLEEISSSSTMAALNFTTLNNIDLSFPSLTEQTRIATILSDMDAELEALERQLGKARKVKQGMMQELLTGKIRLIDNDK